VSRPRRPVLLHGPYHPPAVRTGDQVSCHIRGTAVVTNWSEAPFSWPRCRPLGATSGSGGGLFVDDELARAVRCESSLAVQVWWGVNSETVWRWRKALGVPRVNEGSARLLQELHARQAETYRAKKLSPAEVEHRRAASVHEELTRSAQILIRRRLDNCRLPVSVTYSSV
jgi:hypothetical protein